MHVNDLESAPLQELGDFRGDGGIVVDDKDCGGGHGHSAHGAANGRASGQVAAFNR
jgi:hypothetical protein